MSYVGGARAFERRRASRGLLERLGCLARRARVHGEHGASDLIEVRGGLVGEVHVGETRRDPGLDGHVDQLGIAAGGGGGGNNGMGGVVTGRAQAGKGMLASAGSVGLHAKASTEASISPRRGGSSTPIQPTSCVAQKIDTSSPRALSVTTSASSAVRSLLTLVMAAFQTSSTVMGMQATVGAFESAAAITCTASIAPVLASG